MATNSKTEDTAWWTFDAGWNVHVANREELLREADRLLDGRDLSREFMNECVHLFMMTLCSHWGRVPSVELGNTLEAAVREQARMLFAGELSGSTADGYDLRKREDARVWLSGALTRVAGSLMDRARLIGLAVEPEAAAIEWAVGRVMVAQFARVAQRVLLSACERPRGEVNLWKITRRSSRGLLTRAATFTQIVKNCCYVRLTA